MPGQPQTFGYVLASIPEGLMNARLKRLLVLAALVLVVAGIEYATDIEILGLVSSEREAAPTAVTVPGSAGEVNLEHTRLVSWNIRDLGGSKDDEEIAFMAEVLRDADLVAVQEVVTSPPGAQAVARLDAALDRTGAAWDYRISDPTTGDGSERYAYLWKPSRVRLVGQAWLEPSLARAIDREPYLARFEHRRTGQRLLVASLHAVPRSKDPEREVRRLDALHRQYESDHLVVLGDFNLDDEAFDGLRRAGYAAVLDDQPTSLRRVRREGPAGHLASEYDNIFYERKPLRAARRGVLDFTSPFPTLKAARAVSDHIPVYMDVQWAPGASAPAF